MSEGSGRRFVISSFKNRIPVLLLIVLIPMFMVCQQSNQVDSKYEWFDHLIGQTNSGLFEGQAYYDIYNIREGRHQFFKTSQFQKGSATYKGQKYFNIALRYDIFNDNLIVRNNEVYWVPPMIFDNELLSEFSIGNSTFKNFKNEISDDTGFFEIILRSDSYVLLKKHKKKLFIKTEDDIIYHEFKDGNVFYLQKDREYYKLKSVKDLNSIYPEHKKAIKLLEKKYKTQKKSDFGGYLKSILSSLPNELTTINTKQQ